MKKNAIGRILGYISIAIVIVNIVMYFIIGGENLGFTLNIAMFYIISIIGVAFATISGIISSKNVVLMNVGLGGNAIVMIAVWLIILMNK